MHSKTQDDEKPASELYSDLVLTAQWGELSGHIQYFETKLVIFLHR